MKYLCLIDRATTNGNLLADRELLDQLEELRSAGRIISVDRWQPSPGAVAVRIHNGAAAILDGACPQSSPLASLCLIEARDLNDAIRVATRLLGAGAGCVELRPLDEIENLAW